MEYRKKGENIMNQKNVMVIPSRFQFERALHLQGKSIKTAILMASQSGNLNTLSVEEIKMRFAFLDFVGVVSGEKRKERNLLSLEKLEVLYEEKEIHMALCDTEEGVADFGRCRCPVFVMKEGYLIVAGERISLS